MKLITQKTLLIVLLTCKLVVPTEAMEQNTILTTNMCKTIKELGATNNFALIDLDLSANEQLALDNLQIKEQATYNRYGNLSLLKDELPQFIREIGNNNNELVIQAITDIIYRTACGVKEAFNKETAWVTVRAFIPNTSFDIPRWHMDGYYYSPYRGFMIKFAAALKGSNTLFYPASREMREQFCTRENDRLALQSILDVHKAKSAPQGYGALFIVGDDNAAAIHSEPSIKEARLFFSVVPGNEQEIHELHTLHTR